MAKPLVIVFARAPRYGMVKTRLARDIGASEALRFYRGELARLLRRIGRDPRWTIILCVTPDGAASQRGLWPPGFRLLPQGRGDLGRRMMRALKWAATQPAVVIGSDIPDLSPRHIAKAFAALGAAHFVLGPARDGGYWLIGAQHARHVLGELLDGVRWSSPYALSDSAERLDNVAILDVVLDDIDDAAAYRALAQRRNSTNFP
jgi:uncharacterized protein